MTNWLVTYDFNRTVYELEFISIACFYSAIEVLRNN